MLMAILTLKVTDCTSGIPSGCYYEGYDISLRTQKREFGDIREMMLL